ncbi:MAG: hypothetical protein MPK30_09740, partial [Gammaproteobacteria bacterium]|nr:hypothetical protein [Gammaproteobacteria bacterium]
ALVAVSLLAGFSMAGGAVLLVVLADYRDASINSAGCILSGFNLHDTGRGTAYLVGSVHNTGSSDTASVRVVLVDDLGDGHEIWGPPGVPPGVPPGGTWDILEPVGASISPGSTYHVVAAVSMSDGSEASCSSVVRT